MASNVKKEEDKTAIDIPPYSMKFWQHFNYANEGIFRKIAN